MFRLILKYLLHFCRSGHRKGRGIQSPALYALVGEALFNGKKFPFPERVDNAHRSIMKDPTLLATGGYGAGSQISGKAVRSAASLARWSSVSGKTGRLLYRLAAWFCPSLVLEFGTGLGISTSYLATGAVDARVISVEANREKANYARAWIHSMGLVNVEIVQGLFEESLKHIPDFNDDRVIIFLDGNHLYKPTISCLNQFLKLESKEIMIILDDIHWSKEMEQAWKEGREMERVDGSLDLFFVGILLVKPGMSREHIAVSW